MALIYCPECKKQISDKAKSCPNCGFPINELPRNNSKYNIILTDAIRKSPFTAHLFLIQTKNISLKEATNILSNLPFAIFNNVSQTNANRIKEELLKHNCKVDIIESNENSSRSDEALIDDYFNKHSNEPHCPRCGSTKITAGQRGYSLITGFFGSNQTINRCANCGHTWKPR